MRNFSWFVSRIFVEIISRKPNDGKKVSIIDLN